MGYILLYVLKEIVRNVWSGNCRTIGEADYQSTVALDTSYHTFTTSKYSRFDALTRAFEKMRIIHGKVNHRFVMERLHYQEGAHHAVRHWLYGCLLGIAVEKYSTGKFASDGIHSLFSALEEQQGLEVLDTRIANPIDVEVLQNIDPFPDYPRGEPLQLTITGLHIPWLCYIKD